MPEKVVAINEKNIWLWKWKWLFSLASESDGLALKQGGLFSKEVKVDRRLHLFNWMGEYMTRRAKIYGPKLPRVGHSLLRMAEISTKTLHL
jgi:hypothetical protein